MPEFPGCANPIIPEWMCHDQTVLVSAAPNFNAWTQITPDQLTVFHVERCSEVVQTIRCVKKMMSISCCQFSYLQIDVLPDVNNHNLYLIKILNWGEWTILSVATGRFLTWFFVSLPWSDSCKKSRFSSCEHNRNDSRAQFCGPFWKYVNHKSSANNQLI